VNWIRPAPHKDKRRAVVSNIVGLGVTENAGSFLRSGGTVSFSRRAVLHGVR
jgi:hypothetical protein